MRFLEAHRMLTQLQDGKCLNLCLCMSGLITPLTLQLQAEAAKKGYKLDLRSLPFNTLVQHLYHSPNLDEIEVFLLFPWDFCGECNWRTGLNVTPPPIESMLAQAKIITDKLTKRKEARILYVPAPLPPIFSFQAATFALAAGIESLIESLNVTKLSPEDFDLVNFLRSGFPLHSQYLERIAQTAVTVALDDSKTQHATFEPCKILVTDLDNTLWGGIIAEEGMESITFNPEGKGYRYFLYQSFLKKLKNEGILLAAVTRNDLNTVLPILQSNRMVLSEEDFVTVIASYNSKSAQVKQLMEQLNLGKTSFVFVDDNPLELAEVEPVLSAEHCLTFPASDDKMIVFLENLAVFFSRITITEEDRKRTDLYRQRLKSITPSDIEGTDLTDFLKDLNMVLTIHDHSIGNWDRCIQLINKTNQFNLNGRQIDEIALNDTLKKGGRLFSASLEDRTGNHGEILSCLIDTEGMMEYFVLSCRVFQREVEFAFLLWLLNQPQPPIKMRFISTAHNKPLQNFLQMIEMSIEQDGLVEFNAKQFQQRYAQKSDLFMKVQLAHT